MTLPFPTRPMPAKLRKADGWRVKDVPHSMAATFIHRHHYAHGCSNTSSLRPGLFPPRSALLVGVTMWMTPPGGVEKWARLKQGAAQPVYLSRMAVRDEVPRNAASFLLARSARLLRADGWDFAVTYADPLHGHDGHVYVAAGWSRCGFGDPSDQWRDPTGRIRSRMAGPKRLTVAECEGRGWTREKGQPRPRFVRWL